VDPLTHALLGGTVARVALARPFKGHKILKHAAWLPGAAGALLPDADAAIRSASDPLLYAEFHRHFTHALAFIPIGGTVAALPWMLRRATRPHWKAYLAATTIGYATHGLLDASTTWGTRLLWPFSDMRVGWNWISIIDPLFTIILLTGAGLAVWRRVLAPAAVALALCAAYLAAGAAQHHRALDIQQQLARARGHDPALRDVFPGFANNVLWRSLYRHGDRLYMDRIRVPLLGVPTWSQGTTVAALDAAPAETAGAAARERDLRRFAHFTNHWMARAPDDPGLIGGCAVLDVGAGVRAGLGHPFQH
jgi:inner membrane protein